MNTLLILLVLSPAILAKPQSIEIRGRLLCREKPVQYAELLLYDYSSFGPDFILARDVFADAGGYFVIRGSTEVAYDMRGKLQVMHQCFAKPEEKYDPCVRKFVVDVPAALVTDGVFPRTWHMSDIRLEDVGDQWTECP
ncbi:unnamed protein product [Caenorhabditis sp. 36 PRJEB53466]|nr:unnamed protein product [Caenorhabditis sp. 36 PRJEB53466]